MEKDRISQPNLETQDNNKKDFSIFEGDDYFVYVYKKAEKLAAAVYMISDFFSDKEPLKTNIRSASLCLIDMSLSLNTTASPDRKSLLNNIVKQALSVISYSEIATRAGIESVMNHQILKSELEQFIRTIENRELPQKLGRHFVLNDEFVKNELSDRVSAGFRPETVRTQVVTPGITAPRERKQIPAIDRIEKGNRKSERQEAILAVIKAKGELSIKDLTGVIKGCSEKTIQRELLVLVEQGILSKVGERRWSRYSFVS